VNADGESTQISHCELHAREAGYLRPLVLERFEERPQETGQSLPEPRILPAGGHPPVLATKRSNLTTLIQQRRGENKLDGGATAPETRDRWLR